MSTAFVLGNGVSRQNISLDKIKNFGVIYGCNALYRQFTPDILVAVDTKMIVEIVKSKYHETNTVWTNYNRSFEKFSHLNYFDPPKGWSSGPTALDLASNQNHKTIYILGFDFIGLDDLVNNIYAGTKNYKAKTEKATYYGNWLRQTQTVIKKNNKINYIRVITDKGFIPKELVNFKNLNHITVENFLKIFN